MTVAAVRGQLTGLTMDRSGPSDVELEAVRTPELLCHFHTSRAAFVEALADALSDIGQPDARHRAELLVTLVDGVLHRRLLLGQLALTEGQLCGEPPGPARTRLAAATHGDGGGVGGARGGVGHRIADEARPTGECRSAGPRPTAGAEP
ncbi:hypothetical protein [Streptomyces sp. DT2A-34]|uniref:hypothetical protein n=1 Tax=Streptomyces sp. DT2A-34 TaxID=3051182 RepID=UPI0034641069